MEGGKNCFFREEEILKAPQQQCQVKKSREDSWEEQGEAHLAGHNIS